MYKMRLTRDRKWFFQFFPYFQMRMDNELLKGWVALNYLTDGEDRFWSYKKAGQTKVCGKGMVWLTIIPDDKSRCIGTYILPERRVSTWYIDVIDGVGIDEDGVVYYVDKYLDVLLTPAGDVLVKDRDELDAAYSSGELSREQYEGAIKEGELILKELASDIEATERYCLQILDRAEEMIQNDRFTVFLDIDGVLDVFNPKKELQDLLPEAVGNLKNLVNRTRADVVVVSDWRYGAPGYRERAAEKGFGKHAFLWNMLEECLAKEGIEIKAVTPWDDTLVNRTAEIRNYLEANPNIRRYVILDDCYGDDYSSDVEIKKHLVFVDALKGLQQKDCVEACGVMNLIDKTV